MKKGPKPRVTGVAAAREEKVAEVEEIHPQNCRFEIDGQATKNEPKNDSLPLLW